MKTGEAPLSFFASLLKCGTKIILTKRAKENIIIKNLIISLLKEVFKTENKRRTLMMAVGRTHKAWVDHMRACALEVGIPESYRPVIMFLSRNEGASQKQLAEFANKTTAAINQTVKEMINDGYIRKECDESDQRYTRLFLTEKGMEKDARLRQKLHNSDDVITSVITKEKEEELISLLDAVFNEIKRGF